MPIQRPGHYTQDGEDAYLLHAALEDGREDWPLVHPLVFLFFEASNHLFLSLDSYVFKPRFTRSFFIIVSLIPEFYR